MEKLKDEFVNWQLNEWAKDDYPLTEEQVKTAKTLYNRLMNEEFNREKDLLTQEALLAEIARKLSYGETEASTFRQHSDNRHMYTFDMYLEMGQSDTILEVFEKFNIPTSTLQGVKVGVPSQITTDIGNGNTVYVDAFLKPSPDEDETSKLDIYLNGKKIYSYTGEIDAFDWNDFEEEIKNEELEEQESVKLKQINKDGKQRKSKLLKKTVTPDGVIQKEKITYKNGSEQIKFRNAKGRWIKI